MTDTETRLILGAPMVFVRKNLQKPAHDEVVTLTQRPALCHNGCGLYYVPDTDPVRADAACPDCNERPKAWRVGPAEDIEVHVHMAMGNVRDVTFMRALGKVSRRSFAAPVSLAHVDTPTT